MNESVDIDHSESLGQELVRQERGKNDYGEEPKEPLLAPDLSLAKSLLSAGRQAEAEGDDVTLAAVHQAIKSEPLIQKLIDAYQNPKAPGENTAQSNLIESSLALSQKEMEGIKLPSEVIQKIINFLEQVREYGDELVVDLTEMKQLPPGTKLKIDISPVRKHIEGYLQTDQLMSQEVRQIYQGLLKTPDFQQIVEIAIINGTSILAESELHLHQNKERIVAIDPLYATRLAASIEIAKLVQLGDPLSKQHISTSSRIQTDAPSDHYTSSFLVSKSFRNKGLGRILYTLGNVVSRQVGAQERVVWSDATRGVQPDKPVTSFYDTLGARTQEYSLHGEAHVVPVVNLLSTNNLSSS